MNERPIPAAARRDKDAVEMLRAWIAEERLHCSIKVGMYRDSTDIPEEKAWGILLADVVCHISRAMELRYQIPAGEALDSIRDNFLKALATRPKSLLGGFVD